MKHHLHLAALCGLITAPAFALEPPADNTPPPPPAPGAEAPPAEAPPEAPAAEKPAPPVAMPQVGQPSAYLGVGGEPVDDVLSAHLGLKPGEGVVVRLIDPAGPAAKAGIAENDIITRVGGKDVNSQESLAAAVLEHKPGDEVAIDLIQKGKAVNKSVALGERVNNPAIENGMAFGGGGNLENLDLGNLGEEEANRIREAIERSLKTLQAPNGAALGGPPGGIPEMEKAMEEMQKRMAEMLRQGGLPQPRQMQQLQLRMPDIQAGGGGIEIQRNATFRMMDEDGSIEMKSTNDGTEVTRRDRNDNIVWSGPWDTEQDKAAAPADVRERMEQYNFNQNGNGLRFNFRMQNNIPQPDVEVKPAEEEAPKPAEEQPAEE